MRLMLGLIMLDYRKCIALNVTLSCMVINGYLSSYHLLPEQFLFDMHVPWFVVLELTSCVAMAIFLWVMQTWQENSIRALVLAQASQSSEFAVHGLLSVLCDVVLRLGPESQIATNSQQLSHILAMQPSDRLAGTDFADHVDACDRERFRSFMCRDRAAMPPGPPASIHVHLLEAGGGRVSAQLFRVALPEAAGVSSGDVGSLLGIRALGPPSEVDADKRAQDAAAAAAVSARTAYTSALEDAGPASSASSQLTCDEVQGLSSVSLDVDLASEKFTVRECRLTFADASEDESPSGEVLPKFRDWVPSQCWIPFQMWAQEEMNAAYAGAQESVFETLKFELPGTGGMLVAARRVTLDVPEITDLGQKGEELIASITLEDFAALPGQRCASQGKRSHRVQSLPSILESDR